MGEKLAFLLFAQSWETLSNYLFRILIRQFESLWADCLLTNPDRLTDTAMEKFSKWSSEVSMNLLWSLYESSQLAQLVKVWCFQHQSCGFDSCMALANPIGHISLTFVAVTACCHVLTMTGLLALLLSLISKYTHTTHTHSHANTNTHWHTQTCRHRPAHHDLPPQIFHSVILEYHSHN